MRFTVRRKAAELLAPAGPTPRELKRLSDIDDQEGLRFHIPNLLFYRHDASVNGRDPVAVVRDAVTRALVHYYPFAGRLRELKGRKLAVDCTSEGVLFIEADADVCLEHFGQAPQPPFPGLEELLFDVPGSSQVLGAPLVLFQVTRLSCGGFVLAVRLMHTMADAQGLVQFLSTVAELARGATVPPLNPVWGRELLEARNPPRPGFVHREYDEVTDTNGTIQPLFLLRSQGADEEMRMICITSARGSKGTIPRGYYGNAFALPVAVSTAGELCSMQLSYAVRLVHEDKGEVDMEYMQSVADLMVQRGRPHFTKVRAYLASDVTMSGFGKLDFGWGRPVYADGLGSFLVPCRNAKGEDGIVIAVCLPSPAMDKFVQEMGKLLRPALIKSRL
ncbi:unnamed protein product [Alopecurus aequalis]